MASFDHVPRYQRRPNRSAAERRLQAARAQARAVQRLLAAFQALGHRGCEPTALGRALLETLQTTRTRQPGTNSFGDCLQPTGDYEVASEEAGQTSGGYWADCQDLSTRETAAQHWDRHWETEDSQEDCWGQGKARRGKEPSGIPRPAPAGDSADGQTSGACEEAQELLEEAQETEQLSWARAWQESAQARERLSWARAWQAARHPQAHRQAAESPTCLSIG